MEYFKINYHRLQNLSQVSFYKIIFVFLSSLALLLILSCFISAYHKISFPGFYNDNILRIKVNNKLSDKLKENQYIEFNNKKTSYKIVEFGEYEIIDEEIYQEIALTIDETFIDNEVGIVELYYDKEKIIKHILELFK